MTSLGYDSRAAIPEPLGQHAKHQSKKRKNIGSRERTVSMLAGGALSLLALPKLTTWRGAALAAAGAALLKRGYTGRCELYSALGIDTRKRSNSGTAEPQEYFDRSIHVQESVTIMKPAHELYAFWRNFENLPRVMSQLQEVRCIDEKRSHWVATGPGNARVEWDAEIINDEPDSVIAWRSVDRAHVDNAGSVRFIPLTDGSGTEVQVTMDYIPPAGRVGALIAKLFGKDANQQIRTDLRRFKQEMEAGAPRRGIDVS